MRFFRLLPAVLALLLIAACATGPSLKEQAAAVPAIEPGKARIYFYRTSVDGGAYQPDVLLNGKKVGDAIPRGVFFLDVKPGKYSITTTMTSQVVNLDIVSGEKKFVRFSYSSGFNIFPELMDSATGEAESAELGYLPQSRTKTKKTKRPH